MRSFRTIPLLPFILLALTSCGPTTRPSDLLTPSPEAIETAVSELSTQVAQESARAPAPTENLSLLPGIGPENFPQAVNPLTGLEVSDPSRLDRRPVGVKINNYPRNNRPQWGLSLADLVFEYYHNNDLTRFHAIYYGNDVDMAGPIRSARPFDGYLVETYQMNFVFASADYRVLDHLTAQPYADRLIYILGGDCPPEPVCRFQPEGANHLVVNTALVDDFLRAQGERSLRPDLQGMWFYDQTPDGGSPVERLFIRYSYGAYLYWKFDPQTGRFLRFQDTQEDFGGAGEAYAPLSDRVTREQIAADNVVILIIPHIHRAYTPPQDGNPAIEVVDMHFAGSGEGYALRDGRLYPIRWIRPPGNYLLYLVFPDGSRYPFRPGTTFFQVITPESDIIQDGEDWRVEFQLIPVLEEWKN